MNGIGYNLTKPNIPSLNTWKNNTVEQKRLIQQIVFPADIRRSADGRLSALELPPLLWLVGNSSSDRTKVVGQVGIEPTANRLKAYCSTPELLTLCTGIVRKVGQPENRKTLQCAR